MSAVSAVLLGFLLFGAGGAPAAAADHDSGAPQALLINRCWVRFAEDPRSLWRFSL